MNGKNRRAGGGRWGRAYTRARTAVKPSIFAKRLRQLRTRPRATYRLPRFDGGLKGRVDRSQRELLEFFETYPKKDIYEEFQYNKNSRFAVIYLRQRHFDQGTVRITRPGIYVLQENITFRPNPNDDLLPTAAQISSGLYPTGRDGAYHLGFFAAITIESEDVILDLGGFAIEQSLLHNLEQRFYSHIELSSAPFIPDQGPAAFSNTSNFAAGNRTLVFNGALGRSCHHGVHGNGMSNTVLSGLTISDCEVAGIALNGAINSVLHGVSISNTPSTIPVLATYSQSRFIRSFLAAVKKSTPKAVLDLDGGRRPKTIDVIINELNAALTQTRSEVIDRKLPPTLPLFRNTTGFPDGNLYGIALNVRGAVVGDFVRDRPGEAIGNQNIYLEDIQIRNARSHPREVIALSSTRQTGGTRPGHGGARQVGPAGDVLEVNKLTGRAGEYVENVLSNAQLIVAKYGSGPSAGTANIEARVIQWAEGLAADFATLLREGYSYIGGGDAMGHSMKGNIGVFVSAGRNIKGSNIAVDVLSNLGQSVGQSALIPKEKRKHDGANAVGIVLTGSNAIDLTGLRLTNISSENTVGGGFTTRVITALSDKTNTKPVTDLRT